MTVQEYGLNLNKLSRNSPHMVAESRDEINKFLCSVKFGENKMQECYVTGRYEHL